MKKMIGLLLIMGLMVSFGGCGGDKDSPTGPSEEITKGPQGQTLEVWTEKYDNGDVKVEYQYFRDGEGKVGIGMGKADAVPDAIRKGSTFAQKNMIEVPVKGDTVPHEVTVKYGGTIVMLKPAPPGTGVIAGDSVRAVIELAGIKDIVTKVRRSTNPTNVVKATIEGLRSMKDPDAEVLRRREFAQRNQLVESQDSVEI